jgi:hypothetical protein
MSGPPQPPEPTPRPLTASLVTGIVAALAFGIAALQTWSADQTLAVVLIGLAALSLSVGLQD